MNASLYKSDDDCYVCGGSLSLCRNSLLTLTGFTNTPLCEVLESLTGVNLAESMNIKCAICQECFITLEKHDELQQQSEEIQNKIRSSYLRTHTEKVFIKQEPIDTPKISQVRLECQKCGELFESLQEMAKHEHEQRTLRTQRRQYAKSRVDLANVSSEFIQNAKRQGVRYSYEMFQRAFFTETERESIMKTGRRKDEIIRPKPSVSDSRISVDFKNKAKKHGIDYNIEVFQKTFGFSESEQSTKKAIRKETQQLKTDFVEPEPAPKPRKNSEISSSFLKKLAACGIEYNLAMFQKVFGCTETGGPESRDDHSKTLAKEFLEFRKKGYLDCNHCGVRFTNRSHYLRHNKSHVPRDKKLYCERCSKSFKTPACLQIHFATNHGEQIGPFECPLCFKSYPDRSALRSHYYIHKTERSFLCGRCGATFMHKKSFDMHMMVHDDIRAFPCTISGCSKKFRNSGKLKIHLRVHTGEKIFECPHCPGKKFAQKWGMDLHVKKQHKNEAFRHEVCKICGMKVQSKAKMKLHLANAHEVAGSEDQTCSDDLE